jgi:predicted aspartyl protease
VSGVIGGVEVSLLLDTGAAVTLLREDTWSQIALKNPQTLEPWVSVALVSAGGTPLTIHGCTNVELEMGNEKFTAQVVVVSPLTSEAILGLDFLKEHEALIDLKSRNLHGVAIFH